MTERTRREYLRDFGIAAGGISIAGCLGGGEDGESTPGSTPDSTPTEKSSDSTPEQTDTTEGSDTNTEDGSETDNGGSAGYSPAFGWVPNSGDVRFFAHAFPAQIAEDIGSDATATWEQEGRYIPDWTSELGMADFEYGLAVSSKGEVWKPNTGVISELENMYEKVGTHSGFDIYRGEVETAQGDTNQVVVATDGEHVISHNSVDVPENYFEDTLSDMVESYNGEGSRFVEENGLEQVVANVEYEDGLMVAPAAARDGEVARGRTYNFESDGFQVERFAVTEDGEIEDGESQSYSMDEAGQAVLIG